MAITIATWTVTAILVFFAIAQITIGGYIGALVLAAAAVLISPPGTARILPSLSGNAKARMLMGLTGIALVVVVILADPRDIGPVEDSERATLNEFEGTAQSTVASARDMPPAPNETVVAETSAPSFDTDLPQRTRAEAVALWGELKAARYNSQFHQFGFARGGPFGEWELRRKAIYNEWLDYSRNGPGVETEDAMLGPVIHYMWSVGQDWFRSAGQGDANTADMMREIEAELVR